MLLMELIVPRLLVLLALLLCCEPALAQQAAPKPIRIGELMAYSSLPDEARNWQKGWKLAVDEINNAGGINGKPLEILSRDNKGSPPEAIKIMEEYKNREGIKIVIGTIFSHVGLAASDFAKQNEMLLFRGYAGTSKLLTEGGHDRYFQIMAPSTVWSGILAEKAVQSGKKRWAFIAADYELNRTLIDDFQKAAKQNNPSIEFVETQWYPIGKLEAGSSIQAVNRAKPDGLFVASFGPDYLKLVREGRKRGLFKDRIVISPFAGNASYIRPLGKEAPEGWFSCRGYPVDKLTGPEQKKFVDAYEKAYGEKPVNAAFYGYSVVTVLAKAIEAVGGDDPQAVARYIHSKPFDLPGGQLSFRADGSSTLGEWCGMTGFEKGEPTILDAVFFQAEKYMPPAEDNMKFWTK